MSVVNQVPLSVAVARISFNVLPGGSLRGLRPTSSESRLLREAEDQADIFLRLDGLSIQQGRVVTPLVHGGKRGWEKRGRPADRLKIFDRSIRSDRRV